MRAPALRYRRMLTVMANRNAEYLQQIVDMQKHLHDREKRRQELEEQLFSYLRSEERLTKMQCAKMLCYYKELGERERQAKTRNLELLRNVESLAGKLKEFSVDCSRLLHKRREYKNHITKLKEDGKKVESRGESEAYEQPNRFLPPGMRGSSQSAVAFVGHSSVKVGITSTHSPARTEPVPNHPSFSPQQSALSMHERISNTGNVPFLSDDILNSGVCPEGACVSDMHDCQIESDSDISQREGEPKGWEDLDLASKKAEVSSRSVTLKIPAAVVSLEGCPTRSPLPDIADPRDPSQNRSSRGENEVLSAEEESGSALGNDVLSDHSKSRYPSIPNPAVESRPKPSVHKHTDISVFTNQSNFNSRADDKGRVQNQSGILDDIEPPNRLCMEGFCHLLDVIERRLCAKDINIYHHCTVNEQKLRDIISICRQRGLLDDVDLQICGAVVLQQLPLLCCSLPQRCLLPADLIHTHWSSARKPEHIRLCLSAEGASLWDHCFSHMLHLQNQNVLSTDVTVQIFTPLLVLNNATYTDKAGELLKRLLTYESDTHQPSESERSSSCSLPSLLDDSVEIKAARPSQRYSPVAGTPEIQSAEEDSADQSPVESIPIRETKAYQLLKQTVAQERHPSDTDEEDSESSDVSKSQRADVLPDSITQNSRKSFKSKANTFSAVQSKAFWGESDDSEIEMALRPQSRTSGANDSDDFYD